MNEDESTDDEKKINKTDGKVVKHALSLMKTEKIKTWIGITLL